MLNNSGAMMRGVMFRSPNCVVIGLLLTCVAGCNVIGVLASKGAGEQKAPAVYKLPKLETLVFVESFQNPDLYNIQGQQLTANIVDKLTEEKVAPIVSNAKLDDLRAKDRTAFAKMDIPSIARAVGAKQVIYVNLARFSTDIPIAGTQYSGKGEVRVKVFDAQTGRMLWPPDSSDGRQISYESKSEENVDPRNSSQIQDQICRHLSNRVAELFYDSVPDEPDTSGPQ
jgi:hypothetical protein